LEKLRNAEGWHPFFYPYQIVMFLDVQKKRIANKVIEVDRQRQAAKGGAPGGLDHH